MKCQECSTSFEPKREWQVFCSNPCKQGYNYKNRAFCFYCGGEGKHRDHVFPIAVRGITRSYLGHELVIACVECNVLLQANIFSTIVERFQFLINKYIERYDLKKPAVEWDDYDFEDMAEGFRKAIKKMLKERQVGERRVIFLKARQKELEACLIGS